MHNHLRRYFSYSKYPITSALTVLENEEDNLNAINVFQMLLQFAGVLGQIIATEEDQASHLQSVLEKCWRKESMINELVNKYLFFTLNRVKYSNVYLPVTFYTYHVFNI